MAHSNFIIKESTHKLSDKLILGALAAQFPFQGFWSSPEGFFLLAGIAKRALWLRPSLAGIADRRCRCRPAQLELPLLTFTPNKIN